MRQLTEFGHTPAGLDLIASPFTKHVGSITDRDFVRHALSGSDAILHTATLHKPHVATHSKQDFVDTNITGTLLLLEEAVRAGVDRLVFTSTTSAFGLVLNPPPGAPAAWIDETVGSVPKNIYGVTKTAAEDLCALFTRRHGLTCIVLRTSRFFPEDDDSGAVREAFSGQNAKANEFLFRRVDLEDVVSAHERALLKAPDDGFAKYIISAPSPFSRCDLNALRDDPASIVSAYYEEFAETYTKAGYRMFEGIDRVYVSDLARSELGWTPKHDFGSVLQQIASGLPIGSDLSRIVGGKGYHPEKFEQGPYPVE